MKTAGNKDRNVEELVIGARGIRESLSGLYKDLLRLGRKVKHLEPVGSIVAAAINDMIEAEMAVKAVVDSGNQWSQARGGSTHTAGQAIELVKIRGDMMEQQDRFMIRFRGKAWGELYFNMRGYQAERGIPVPRSDDDHTPVGLNIGEKSLAAFKREISKANREWARADRTGSTHTAEQEEFPQPANVSDDKWQVWLDEVAPLIAKALKAGGVRVKKFNPNDAFYRYIELKKGNREFSIGLTDISNVRGVKELMMALRKFSRIEDVYDKMENVTDPFYSNISLSVDSEFGKGAGSSFAFKWVTDWIRQSGRRVWS